MGIIRVYEKAGKTKKKPGWQKAAAEEAAWLARLQGTRLFANKKPSNPKLAVGKRIDPVVRTPVVEQARLCKLPSLQTFGGAGTKPVARPDILYKDDPELLARELKARERKFNVAPAYNKGADQLVTEEELANMLRSNKRRS